MNMNVNMNINEDRVRELESWAQGSREGLTTSECVLLDAIAEICQEVRRSWADEESRNLELGRVRARLQELQNALVQDRRAMEAIELELTLGGSGFVDKARELLTDRLTVLDSLTNTEAPPNFDKTDVPGITD